MAQRELKNALNGDDPDTNQPASITETEVVASATTSDAPDSVSASAAIAAPSGRDS